MDEITKRAIEGIKPLNEITKPVENIKPLNEIPNLIVNKKPIEDIKLIEEKIIQEKEDKKVEEIDNILMELPMKDVEPKKIITSDKKKSKVPKIFSNKIFKYGVIVIGVILLCIFLFSSPNCECIPIEGTTNVSCPEEGLISYDSIKQQILDKGYAEITDNDSTIKLSPYIQ